MTRSVDEPLDAGAEPPAPAAATSLGDPAPTTPPEKAPRDWLIDVLRVVSMFVVVLMHWTLMRVTLDDGKVQMTIALHGPAAVVATWVLQVMPLFFICGGFANTVTFDKVARDGGGFGDFVGVRARRLLTPLLPLMVFMALLVVVLGALGMGVTGDIVADQAANVLWFLSAYLVCVAATPLLVRLHDRAGWWAPLLLLGAGIAVMDVLRYRGLWADAGNVNLYLVWLFAHQLGVLYARRTLHRIATVGLLALAVAVGGVIALLVLHGPYAAVNLGLADHPRQNLMPPNAVFALLALVQLALLTPVARATLGWQPVRVVKAVVQRLNLLLMVIFLWHLPASFAAIGIGMTAPDVLLPHDEGTWWAIRPIWYLMEIAFLALFVLVTMRWELICHRFAGRTNAVLVAIGVIAGVVGVYHVWHEGFAYTYRASTELNLRAIMGQILVVVAVILTTALRAARTTPRSAS